MHLIWRFLFCLPIHWWSKSFQLQNWSQRYNVYQTVIMKVSNNKLFVFTYKSRNTISIPKQFITNMYSRGNASPKAYRFWRLETARSVPATSLSRPTQLFVHSRARWRLRANTSRRIKRLSGCYHPTVCNGRVLPSATISFGDCRVCMHSEC